MIKSINQFKSKHKQRNIKNYLLHNHTFETRIPCSVLSSDSKRRQSWFCNVCCTSWECRIGCCHQVALMALKNEKKGW